MPVGKWTKERQQALLQSEIDAAKRRELTRRKFLQRAAAGIAVPTLVSLLPRTLRAAPQPGGGTGSIPKSKYFVFCNLPNGIPVHHPAHQSGPSEAMIPGSQGVIQSPTTVLSPLLDASTPFTLVSNLYWKSGCKAPLGDYYMGPTGNGTDGDHGHPGGTTAFTGASHHRGSTYYGNHNGATIDHIIGEHIANQRPYGQKGVHMRFHSGQYSKMTYATLSYRGVKQPNVHQHIPSQLLSNLCVTNPVENSVPQEGSNGNARHRSILDFARERLDKMACEASAEDRATLDQFTTSVREVEMRIQDLPPTASCAGPGTVNTNVRSDSEGKYQDLLTAFYQLVPLTLQTGSAPVATVMLDNIASNQTYGYIGASNLHHDDSHYGTGNHDATKFNRYAKIVQHHVRKFGEMVESLKGYTDVDGQSVYDGTTAVFTSNMGSGSYHEQRDMAAIIAGGGGGYWLHNTNNQPMHVAHRPGTSGGHLGDFLSTLARAHGHQQLVGHSDWVDGIIPEITYTANT